MNFRLLAIILPFMLISSAASAQVSMGNLVITVKAEKNTIEASDLPTLIGTVTDQANRPVSGALVKISTSFGTTAVVTDLDGTFRYQYDSPVSANQYKVSVKAQKAGYGIGLASTTFFVKGIPTQQDTKSTNFKTVSGDKIKNDPIAYKIMKNIETAKKQQAEQEKKLQEIEDNKKFLEEQRKLANQELQNDLGVFFKQFDPFTPRNAYASFISQVNATLQNVYWGQFNFTEQKTNDGRAAKMQVLQNGGSDVEARKAFIQKATSSRSEIIKVNKDLNEKYGFAKKDIQAKFNTYGKMPRHNK